MSLDSTKEPAATSAGAKPASGKQGMRLHLRILAHFVPLVAVSMGLLMLVVDRNHGHAMLELHQEKGLAIAKHLAASSSNSLLSYNYIFLQQLADGAVQEDGVCYVLILDKEGEVAGFSDGNRRQAPAAEDVSRALTAADVLIERREHPALDGDGLDITVPVFVEDSQTRWGTVRLGVSLATLHATQARTRLYGFALAGGVLLLAIMVGLLLAHHITDPIARLVKATGELANGNFDYQVNLSTGDEIEVLADRLDQLARRIREHQDSLQAANLQLAGLNSSLEEKVVERTRALVEAEEKYRILVENSPNPICILQDDKVRFFNRAFAETFGYAPEELIVDSFSAASLLASSEDNDAFLVMTNRADRVTSREIRGRRRDGSQLILDMRSTVISYHGEPALEAILLDITERRKVQEQAMATERLRALGEMASGVAHDFNNVLGSILGRAQLLQRAEQGASTRKGLQIIEKAARDGGETVKRIQNFTRVRTDQDFAPVDLNQVVEDVVEMTRSRWADEANRQGKQIEIIKSLNATAPALGNISELREVFTNMVLNAVDAIPEKGLITVETLNADGLVHISVSDTGLGMSPEVRRRLFDPFFTTKGTSGTGLGMAVAYGILRRHKAEIDVESEPDAGTRFTISLPAATSEAASPQSPVTVPATQGERVLVVDDDPEINTVLAEILADSGYRVDSAGGGGEAIALLRENTYELLVTDLGMPEISGWEVAGKARELHPRIKLMLVTGWGGTLDTAELARYKVDAVMKKPFDMDEVLATVAGLLKTTDARRVA